MNDLLIVGETYQEGETKQKEDTPQGYHELEDLISVSQLG